MNIRLNEIDELEYEQIKKKILPLIYKEDMVIEEKGNTNYTMSDEKFYFEFYDLVSELDGLLKYDLNAKYLKDIIAKMDFNIDGMTHVGDSNLAIGEDSKLSLIVDNMGVLMFLHLDDYLDLVDVYLLHDSDLIIKFLEAFIQLLEHTKKDKKKLFDYLCVNKIEKE